MKIVEWIAGFLIALTVGLTGIGGGSFTVPVLVLIGVSTNEAVGTAMIFASVLRLIVAPAYVARRHIQVRYLLLLLIGAVPGLLIGTWGLRSLQQSSWRPAVLLLVGIMLSVSSSMSFIPHLRKPEFAKKNPRWLALLALPIGMETGFSSAGAGALGTILLLNFSEISIRQVVGTDILFGIVLGVLGSAFHLGWGSIHNATLLHLLAGGVPGSLIGCALGRYIPGSRLRAAVALIAVALGLQLIWTSSHNLLNNVKTARWQFKQEPPLHAPLGSLPRPGPRFLHSARSCIR